MREETHDGSSVLQIGEEEVWLMMMDGLMPISVLFHWDSTK
jgi:hypothetical protein